MMSTLAGWNGHQRTLLSIFPEARRQPATHPATDRTLDLQLHYLMQLYLLDLILWDLGSYPYMTGNDNPIGDFDSFYSKIVEYNVN